MNLKIFFVLSIGVLFTSQSYAHCKWRHPGHCITEPIKKVVKEAKRVEKRVEKEINRTDENLHDIVKSVGKGTEKAVRGTRNFTLHIIEQGGEEVAEFLCGLVGKEPTPEDGCNVNVGAEVNSEGDVTATDGQGKLSEKPEPTLSIDKKDQLAWLRKIELQDWEQSTKDDRYIVGGLLMLAPILPSNITWFNELPSSPTESGNVRIAYGNTPALVGTRRIDNGVARLHRGTDYSIAPGGAIYASFDGKVIAVGQMSNKPFHYVHIKNERGIVQRSLYVAASVSVGDTIKRGVIIGNSENLHVENGYSNSVSNHVHIEYRNPEGHSLAPDGNYLVAKEQGNAASLCKNNKCFSPSSN